MKEETKKKIKKIAKVSGFIITFGFAVFGVLCAAMLMANLSGAKDNIKTLDSSLVQNEVRSERIGKPRKAEEDDNLLYNYIRKDAGLAVQQFSDETIRFAYSNPAWTNYFWDKATMPSGYYVLEGNYSQYIDVCAFFASSDLYQDVGAMQPSSLLTFTNQDFAYRFFIPDGSYFKNNTPNRFYFYFEWGNFPYFSLNVRGDADLYFKLVDTLDVPSSSILKLPNNWSPFSLITDQVTDDNRFGLLKLGSPTSATLVGPDVELTNIIFRYRGVVYDKIHFSFSDASHSTGYVRSDGSVFDPLNQYAVQNVDTHVISLNYVSFGQSWTNREDKVVGSRYSDKALPESPVNGVMWYPALGQYYWVNGGAPTIEIIDLKSETSSGRYNGRYANLNDLQLLELLSNYSASTLDIGDTGMVFDLMTTAFNSLTPVLSIYILPGLTLGMILFVPLIGGIIVIIIKVIKK